MNWKIIFPIICIAAYPVIAWLVCKLTSGTGDAMGDAMGLAFVTFIFWALWFVVSLFVSHFVMGSAWWALLFMPIGIVVATLTTVP